MQVGVIHVLTMLLSLEILNFAMLLVLVFPIPYSQSYGIQVQCVDIKTTNYQFNDLSDGKANLHSECIIGDTHRPDRLGVVVEQITHQCLLGVSYVGSSWVCVLELGV